MSADQKREGLTEAERRDLRRIAQGYVTAYARMVEIGEGFGGLAIRHRDLADLMMEFDQTFTDGQSTILTLLDALDAAEQERDVERMYGDAARESNDRLMATVARVSALAEAAPWVPHRTDRAEVTRHVRMVKAVDITAALAGPERDHVAEADAIRKQVEG